MKKNENIVKRIYDKQTKTWFEVSPEQYEEFDRWRTNLRKREQYHHRCMCPRSKWWLCDGMCQDCEFHAPGDTLSLDMTVANKLLDHPIRRVGSVALGGILYRTCLLAA